MKCTILSQYFSLFALALNLAASSVNAEPINTSRFGLYVVADDMDRASAFYEQLFGAPEIRMPSLVGFDVAGGLYAVVSRETYAVDAIHGDTMRAYINVGDIDETFARVRAIASNHLESDAVIVEGPFRFFRVRDPDGNILEFFSIDPSPSDSQ
ncbi:VOC family protein [Rhodobacteraceae bacterium R_SAG4]|uniref:VOC family protein n=1 Tax=Tritonibacter mobilis TaxID=379347 RepID=UPI00144566B3|nr:VOC family protein [Tritonibacter mobilis]MCA2009801.1 VOC family protein [Tritonibacter mobilis]NKX37375.1 VOC family protein [Rhodobacteraceae bacterium R_SAG4]